MEKTERRKNMSTQILLKSGLKVTGNRPKKTPLFMAIAALLLVVAMVLSGCQPKTHSEEVIAAVKKTFDYETIESSANLSFNLAYETVNPTEQAFSELFNNISLHLLQKFDQKDLRYQLDFNLFYKGLNCGSFTLYADMEKVVFQSPFLYHKPFCFNWEDSPAFTSKYLNGIQIHSADYLRLIFDENLTTFKRLQEVYYAAYADFLAERVTVNKEKVHVTLAEKDEKKTFTCQEYILDLDYNETFVQDYQKFISAILKNETLLTILKEKIGEFVELAKNNGDLATWPWTENEIRDFAENLDTYLNQLLEVVMENIILSVDTSTSLNQIESDYRIRIDESGLIRNMAINQNQHYIKEEAAISPLSINITMNFDLFNYGEQLAFTEFDPAGAFDLGKASETEWTTVREYIMMKAIEQIMVNPLLQDFIALFMA